MRGSNSEVAKAGLAILKNLARETRQLRHPPEQGAVSPTEEIIPFSVVRGTRGYLEAITHQINGSYHHGWYDACLVMMRRLVETLIVEVFEKHEMAAKIQTSSGDFLQLEALIGKIISEPSWSLGRATKRALLTVKRFGDNSAHSRRFSAHRGDIDNVQTGFRTAVQELISLAGLRD